MKHMTPLHRKCHLGALRLCGRTTAVEHPHVKPSRASILSGLNVETETSKNISAPHGKLGIAASEERALAIDVVRALNGLSGLRLKQQIHEN